jgi:nitrogen fixation protein NifQ
MEPALADYLRQRFGAEQAAQIQARWCANFGLAPTAAEPAPPPDRHEEYGDVLTLLMEHAAEGAHVAAVARWIAYSCMGGNHLWEDLGLPERPELTRLIADCFPTLRALNSKDMRWKKFFYRRLCERAELFLCRSPTCEACSEFAVCYPNQTGAPVGVASAVAG